MDTADERTTRPYDREPESWRPFLIGFFAAGMTFATIAAGLNDPRWTGAEPQPLLAAWSEPDRASWEVVRSPKGLLYPGPIEDFPPR